MPEPNLTAKQLRDRAAVTCARMRTRLASIELALDDDDLVGHEDALPLVGLLQVLRQQLHMLALAERDAG